MLWERDSYVVGTRYIVIMSWEQILCRGHEILCRGHEILCRGNEILSRGNEIIMSWERDKKNFTCPLSAAV